METALITGVAGFIGSALGKIVCGCRFQSYYPITPASDESKFLKSYTITKRLELCEGMQQFYVIGKLGDRKSTRLNSSHT